eukprot:6202207-Pleurochrysis_carterae.AAC.2
MADTARTHPDWLLQRQRPVHLHAAVLGLEVLRREDHQEGVGFLDAHAHALGADVFRVLIEPVLAARRQVVAQVTHDAVVLVVRLVRDEVDGRLAETPCDPFDRVETQQHKTQTLSAICEPPLQEDFETRAAEAARGSDWVDRGDAEQVKRRLHKHLHEVKKEAKSGDEQEDEAQDNARVDEAAKIEISVVALPNPTGAKQHQRTDAEDNGKRHQLLRIEPD